MKRLIDDPQISGELRAEMQRYASEQAQVDLKRVYTSLQASLPLTAALSAPHARAAGGAWSGLSGATKLLLVAAIGGTAALGLGALSGAERAPSSARATLAATNASTGPATSAPPGAATAPIDATPKPLPSAQQPVAATSGAQQAVTAPSDQDTAASGGSSPTRAEPPRSSGLALQPFAADTNVEQLKASRNRVNATSASRREIAQLARIKALLEQDPAAARRLIRAAQREFPAGLLVEEREGLDVIALFALEEMERARKNAQRFVVRYPQSPLRPKLERLITEASE